jgi:amylosucrase
MALLWNSLATREVRLLRQSMSHRFAIDPQCAWVNYVRCHDDIGWTFDDVDAARLGINGFDHRNFLNFFYTGRFEGSFARGLPFQENPRTGDARISGSLASLSGLEQALQSGDPAEIDLAIGRIVLLHAVIMSIGGIPLIYLGDEVGWVNDYTYRSDPARAPDSRWVHRPRIDWSKMDRRTDAATVEGRIFARLLRLIELRKQTPAFSGNDMQVAPFRNDHVFGFVRSGGGQRVLVLVNFTERSQSVDANEVRLYGLNYSFQELVGGSALQLDGGEIPLQPYQVMWLLAG